jgi:hypothetical protein
MLEEWPDGPLPAAAAAHLDDCRECRQLFDDLERIRIAGMEWGSDEVAPPESLWMSLQAQLASEGLIRPQAAGAGWFGSWFGTAPRWALAGASVSLLLIASMLATYRANESAGTDFHVRAVVAAHLSIPNATENLIATDLGKTLDGDLKRVFDVLPERNPLLASSLRKNLGIVDNLIAVCEKSVREQPNDEMARDYLYGAYEQKAVLLATATDRSASEGQ